MLYSESLREMMQNAVNESFWDGLGVEIGPCAIFPKNVTFQDPDFFSRFWEGLGCDFDDNLDSEPSERPCEFVGGIWDNGAYIPPDFGHGVGEVLF